MTTKSSNCISNTIAELERCNEVLRLLTDDLAEVLEEPSGQAITKWVLNTLDEMIENLEQQFRLEEHSDYLSDVLERFPNWHPQVEHLRQQHGLLHRQLREIRERVAAEPQDGTVLFESRRQLADWINTYNEHQHQERRLVQDALTLETGVGE